MISEIPTAWYLLLAAILFAIGAGGVLVRRNTLVILMCVEMMMNAVNLTFVAFSRQLGSIEDNKSASTARRIRLWRCFDFLALRRLHQGSGTGWR